MCSISIYNMCTLHKRPDASLGPQVKYVRKPNVLIFGWEEHGKARDHVDHWKQNTKHLKSKSFRQSVNDFKYIVSKGAMMGENGFADH